MTENQNQTNRRAADRLAEIREELRTLKAEEESLRQGFIDGTLDADGDDVTVTVETKTTERIDLKAMRASIAAEIWRPYLVEKETVYVKVTRKSP
jgi:hypothetical protein